MALPGACTLGPAGLLPRLALWATGPPPSLPILGEGASAREQLPSTLWWSCIESPWKPILQVAWVSAPHMPAELH